MVTTKNELQGLLSSLLSSLTMAAYVLNFTALSKLLHIT